jgi:hypothetical protein
MRKPLLSTSLLCMAALTAPFSVGAASLPVEIGLYPTTVNSFSVGEAASVSFDVRVSGMEAIGQSLRAYDFIIAYDPLVMQLSGWSGFGDFLGNEGVFEVFNGDYFTSPNSTTNYQTLVNSPPWLPGTFDPATVAGASLGTPTDNGTFFDGSLRFTQASFLSDEQLKNGGGGPPAAVGGDQYGAEPTDTFTLFSLTFDVVTSSPRFSDILIIDDRNYEGFSDTTADTGFLDYKLGCYPSAGCEDNSYLTRVGSFVQVVPVPATLPLLAVGVMAAGFVARRNRRA